MNIDKIYEAAVAGNLGKLESYLRSGKVDINQMIETEMGDGVRGSFPMLFSVLAAMNQQGIQPQALEMLVRYGVDVNGYVVLDQPGMRMTVPILSYALLDWTNPDIVEFLLSHGANPNDVKLIEHSNGDTSSFPMLQFAISNKEPKSVLLMELLMQYGAEPDGYALVSDAQDNIKQYMLMLHFALVEEQNSAKCISLLRHGASPDEMIHTGDGVLPPMPFRQYVQQMHPHLSPMLEAACSVAAQGAHTATAAPAAQGYAQNSFVPQNQNFSAKAYEQPAQSSGSWQSIPQQTAPQQAQPQRAAAKPAAKRSAAPSQPVSGKRLYGKFKAYLFGNFGLLALAFGVIAPLVMEDPDLKGGFFFMGLLSAGICALLWLGVSRKAKARNMSQLGVFGQLVLDSMLMVVKVLLCMTVVLIPLVSSITSHIEWEDRRTTSGQSVRVKKIGNGRYEDAMGNRYSD